MIASPHVDLYDRIHAAMKRESNPNKTPEAMASVLSVVSGIPKEDIRDFINGQVLAINNRQAELLLSLDEQ